MLEKLWDVQSCAIGARPRKNPDSCHVCVGRKSLPVMYVTRRILSGSAWNWHSYLRRTLTSELSRYVQQQLNSFKTHQCPESALEEFEADLAQPRKGRSPLIRQRCIIRPFLYKGSPQIKSSTNTDYTTVVYKPRGFSSGLLTSYPRQTRHILIIGSGLSINSFLRSTFPSSGPADVKAAFCECGARGPYPVFAPFNVPS